VDRFTDWKANPRQFRRDASLGFMSRGEKKQDVESERRSKQGEIMSFHAPNKYRFKKQGHPYTSNDGDNFGAFFVPFDGRGLKVIATDGKGITGKDKIEWEHVSVSLSNRCPNWKEMSFLKDLFWDSEDLVVQFHPPKSQYVNQHPFTLHLWRPVGIKIPLPPQIFVGVQS